MKPNDPYYDDARSDWNQWALEHMGAPDAWSCLGNKASNVAVAVVDRGVVTNHEDLQGRVEIPTHTVINTARADGDHGTSVAGIIAAQTNNARGIAGAAGPASVRILSVKFCSEQVLPSPSNGANGINEAVRLLRHQKHKGVICLPWDVGYHTPELEQAIADAGRKSNDVLVVVAAGNSSLDIDRYPNWPASYGHMNHVITVMATGQPSKIARYDETRATFSNYGRKSVHISAPGVAIMSTTPYFGLRAPRGSMRVGYRYFSGTSAATALVAGLAALLRAKHPSWTAPWVKSRIINTAMPVPALKGQCVSGGIAHFRRAVC